MDSENIKIFNKKLLNIYLVCNQIIAHVNCSGQLITKHERELDWFSLFVMFKAMRILVLKFFKVSKVETLTFNVLDEHVDCLRLSVVIR